MAMSTLRELFVHDLEDIYGAEHQLRDALEELASQTEDEDIASSFREHREETEGQIGRLKEAFELLGHEATVDTCDAVKGLTDEHDAFVGTNPEQDVLDLHNLVAAQKTEHYEIAAYGNLALLADRLGEDEVADLLHENLEEEEAALDELTTAVEAFDYDTVTESQTAD
jgi:ferritin-like metal-binding protein YciE